MFPKTESSQAVTASHKSISKLKVTATSTDGDKELNYDVLSIVFDASNEILHERFLKRLNENRHYVHKSQDFTNIEDFIKTQDELRNAPYFGNIINVNCDDFSYQDDSLLLQQIDEFIKKLK